MSGVVGLVRCPEVRRYDHGPRHPLRPDRVRFTFDLIDASSGEVVFAEPSGTYGLTVLIQHGGGAYSLYASLQSARVRRHEVDRFRCRAFGRDEQIAFVLAILVVNQDEHPAVARVLDQFLDRRQEAQVDRAALDQFALALGHRHRFNSLRSGAQHSAPAGRSPD